MALVTTTEMFKKAYEGGYAIGAFNVNNMEIIQGIVGAAKKLNAPVILQCSKGARDYAGLGYITKMVEAACADTDVPIALHLDHGPDFETCKQCIDGGFTSVMIDGSSLPYEENIALTKKVVEYAHAHGCVVEGELGTLAGVDLQFNTTFASLNGECVTDGGVIVFVKTTKKFTIQKENIFKPSGRKVVLTGVDTANRKLLTIDGKPATTEYARAVGIPENRIDDASLMNPLGRMFGDNIFISSIAGVNSDRSFNMYCRVMPNTKVDIMELGDVKAIMDSTCNAIEENISRPGFVFFINCILRTLAFESNDQGNYLVNLYQSRFGKVAGFSSYGEQIGKVNSNQTLVVLAMEE